MNKKGVEVSPPSLVVIIILVLLVLLILIFIFGDQSGKFLEQINIWRDDITTESKCENPIFGRSCGDRDCGEGYKSRPVPNPPSGEWDCDNNEGCYECVPEQ